MQMKETIKKLLTDKSARSKRSVKEMIVSEAQAGHPWCC